ncbi:MAG: hypothetical protein UT73_C0007G0025, partial [Candidatus Nomurabacteria bacterium GW2011_GWB1_40_11]
WPSSVRGLNCTLKWANERNPRCVLQVSHETAPTFVREANNFQVAIYNFQSIINDSI